jgi:integrase
MRTRGKEPARAELERDPDLRSWYENTSNGSRITGDVYLRRLRAFCEQMGVDRADLHSRKLKETDLRDLLVRFVNAEVKKGRSGEYIRSSVKAVRSWLLHHNRRVELPIKIPGMGTAPSLENEELPTQEQLRSVLLQATSNERLSCAFMAFSGLRPEALGNYDGTDGLTVGDLEGVSVKDGRIEIATVPLRVRVRAPNSKAGHAYYTFLGEEGARYLRESLEERLRKGETISAETDIIHPYRAKKRFVRALNVGDQVRLALRRAGIAARPYCLRSYFASRLLEASNAGKVARDYSEFWLGHRGDVTARHYTTGRARLPETLVESMRQAYRRCEPYVSTMPSSSRAASNAEAFRAVLSPYYTDEEIGKLDLEDPAVVIEAIRKGAAKRAAAAGPRQQLIAEADLPKYLAEGWVARMPVNGSQFVVERVA